MDMASLRKRGAFVIAWVRQTFEQDQKNLYGNPYRSAVYLQAFSCDERQMSSIQLTQFLEADGAGAVVASQSLPRDTYDWSDVSPDSIGEAELDSACQVMKLKSTKVKAKEPATVK
jgi:hypothetical protein